MSFPRDAYPYTNFHELNLGYFITHFREIFSQWADLYDQMTDWKDATDEELATWKASVEDDLDQREEALRAELETWKAQTGLDIAGWENATLAALTAWQTATQAVFEAIRVEAAGSATAAAASAGDAATAKTAAETAQAAAEAAAASIASSAAQIATNTADISDLKTQLKPVTVDGSLFANIWDEQWEVGVLDDNTGEPKPTTSTRIRSKNYIPVNSNKTYYVNKTDNGANSLVGFVYDSSFTAIQFGENTTYRYIGGEPFTVPANARYLKFYTHQSYGTTYQNDICVNESQPNTDVYPYNGIYVSHISPVNIGSLTNVSDLIHDNNTQKMLFSGMIISENIKENYSSGYITTNKSAGETIDPTVNTGTNYAYIIVPCNKGDVFTITGKGADAPRLWCFTDGNYKVISVSADNATLSNYELTAPDNGYFISNVLVNNAYDLYVTHVFDKYAYDNIENDIKSVSEYVATKNYPMMWAYGYIRTSDGEIVYSDKTIHTKYKLKVKEGTVVSCESGVLFGVATYNPNTGSYITKKAVSADPWRASGEVYIMIDAQYTNVSVITDFNDVCSKVNFTPTASQFFDYVDKDISDIHDSLDGIAENISDISDDINKIDYLTSLFDKRGVTSYIGVPSGIYYDGLLTQYDEGFGASTITADVIDAFDGLVTDYGSNYITKNDLGVCSDGTQHIYEYVLNPKYATYEGTETPKHYPKILIMSAQHGFEKSSVYGIYYFVKDMLSNWDKSPVLDYLRHHCIIKIIPIANPYGFDNNSYLNANGVNLNRNYDTAGFPADPSAQPGDSQYGGVTAFDQIETQYVRDWILDNLDAIAAIDFHTNGSASITAWNNVNWISLCGGTDIYYRRLWDAAFCQFANTTAHFAKDYTLDIGSNVLGRVTGINNAMSTFPSADVWITNQHIPSMTFEGFNGFVNGTAFSADEQKANSELIGNWLINILNAFK